MSLWRCSSRAVCLAVIALAATGARPSGNQARTQWDGVYTEAQAQRGNDVYSAHCAGCHGPTLSGAEMAPALAGFAFAANWDQLTLGDLFDRIRKSMPPEDPGSLTRQEYTDVVAYLLQFGQAPAGKDELPPNADLLRQIRYSAVEQ